MTPETAASARLPRLSLAAATALSIASALSPRLSMLALPAGILLLLAVVRARGRLRVAAAVVGGAAAAVGLVRFTLDVAVPNIVSSGQFAAEERAVSRLRELLWAEDQVLQRGWVDTDGDGRGEYAFLGELLGLGQPRRGARLAAPLLRREQFHPATDGMTPVYRSEGYDYVVYLPGPSGAGTGEGRGAIDARQASQRFAAYAWPVEWGKGGVRAFYIDQDDRICQTSNAQGYSGTARIPGPRSALAPAGGLGVGPCGSETGDGGRWTPWKNKKPRPARPGDLTGR